ncbi:MAG: hypothetical protein GF350_00535 [Chitinivibrionales bacterium]|nr:hypothetical protein [Chitinivibrionales bacterium]
MRSIIPVFVFCIAACHISLYALGGVAVSIHNTSYEPGKPLYGEVVRHTITSSAVSRSEVIRPGPARCVCINPEGSQIAYITEHGALHLGGIHPGAGDIVPVKNLHENSWIDWPADQWVYYTAGEQCGEIRRVNTYTHEKELVARFPHRISQISIATDLVRGTAVIFRDAWYACVFDLEDGKASILNERPGIGGEISPDGSYFAHSQGGYTITRVRRSKDASIISEWGIRKANVAGSAWGSLRWAANSNNWLTITQASSVGNEKDNIVLFRNQMIYRRDGNVTVQVTRNSPIEGGYDEAGDLWIGDPRRALGKKKILRLQEPVPEVKPVAGNSDGLLPCTVPLTNTGSPESVLPELHVSTNVSWLTPEIVGSGNDQRIVCIINRSQAVFVEQRGMVSVYGQDCDTVTFPLVYSDRQGVEFAALKIEPGRMAIKPGATLQFRAMPLDGNGNVIDREPGLVWAVEDGGGTIDSTGRFSADSSVGGIRIIAEARLNGTVHTAICTTFTRYPALRANVGGGLVAGEWLDAAPFTAGGAGISSDSPCDTTRIYAPAPEGVYATGRRGTMTFTFPHALVPDGRYRVRLHGNSAFSRNESVVVVAEGDTVYGLFDLGSPPDSPTELLVVETDIRVTDGNGLTVHLAAEAENGPAICGIEILDHHIYNSALALLAPNGDERYRVGDKVTVTWDADVDAVDSIELLLSLDNGKQWIPIGENDAGSADRIAARAGSYSWAVPLELQGIPVSCSQCRLMIRHPRAVAVDRSDEAFSIYSLSQNAIDENPDIVDKSFGIHIHGSNNIAVSVPFDGLFNIDIVGIDGTLVSKVKGFGPQDYLLTNEILTSGIYLIRVTAHNRRVSRLVMIGN